MKVGELEQTIVIFRVFLFLFGILQERDGISRRKKKLTKLDGSDLRCQIEMRNHLFFGLVLAARLVNIIQIEFIIAIRLI